MVVEIPRWTNAKMEVMIWRQYKMETISNLNKCFLQYLHIIVQHFQVTVSFYQVQYP